MTHAVPDLTKLVPLGGGGGSGGPARTDYANYAGGPCVWSLSEYADGRVVWTRPAPTVSEVDHLRTLLRHMTGYDFKFRPDICGRCKEIVRELMDRPNSR